MPGREEAGIPERQQSAGSACACHRQRAKSFVFEAKLNRDTIRRTIGDVRAWNIEKARKEANCLRGGDRQRT